MPSMPLLNTATLLNPACWHHSCCIMLLLVVTVAIIHS